MPTLMEQMMGCEPEAITQRADAPSASAILDLPQGVPPLTSLYLYIAGSCNLACRHCWISPVYEPDNTKGQFLKLEDVKKAITEAKPLGLGSVKLTGGEPLLHPHIRELIEWVDGENIRMVIETNGTLVDTRMAAFLKSKPQITFISVSLDGATAETHETLRGVTGCYSRAVTGIRNLVAAGFHPQLICTLYRGNVEEIESIVDWAEIAGCGSVKFNHVQHMGRGETLASTQGLKVAGIIEIYQKRISEIEGKRKIPIYFDIPHAFRPIRKMLKNDLCRCSISNVLGILASGELALCGIGVNSPELVFGHINKDNIRTVWTENDRIIKLREAIPSQLEGICGNCLHQFDCRGNCVANNFHLSGRLNAPYFFCQQADKQGVFPESRKRDIIIQRS